MFKKGEATIGMIIFIALGILVLVVVGIGFTMGWQELWNKMTGFGGGSSLSAAASSCKILCINENTIAFTQTDLKSVKGLEPAQVNNLANLLPAGANSKVYLVYEKDTTSGARGKFKMAVKSATAVTAEANEDVEEKPTIQEALNAQAGMKLYSEAKDQYVNFNKAEAKVSCEVLVKAGYAEECTAIGVIATP